jgi:hypothetical protein
MKFFIIIITLFLSNCSNVSAQVEAIRQKYLNNPNVVWAVEMDKDYILDDQEKVEDRRNNRMYTLKILRNSYLLSDEQSTYLRNMIEEGVFSNQIKIYTDGNLTLQADTLSVMYSRNRVTCVVNDSLDIPYSKSKLQDVYEYRLKAIVFYDTTKANWGMEVIALAPLYNTRDVMGNIILKEPLFWMKIENNQPDILSNDITWAKRISDRNAMIYTFNRREDSDAAMVIKEIKPLTIDPVAHLFDRMEKDTLLKVNGWEDNKLLSWEEKQKLIYSRDTVRVDGQT